MAQLCPPFHLDNVPKLTFFLNISGTKRNPCITLKLKVFMYDDNATPCAKFFKSKLYCDNNEYVM